MAEAPQSASKRLNGWTVGGGAIVLLVIALPLWREFRVPGNAGWNIFLAAFLVALGIGTVLLQHYFLTHSGEIGEARFDTRNAKDRPNG